MRTTIVVVTILVVLFAGMGFAWALGGNTLYSYLNSQDPYERGIAAGYIDGSIDAHHKFHNTFNAPLLYRPPRTIKKGQTIDIVHRYLARHPEKRHEDAQQLIYNALSEVFPP
jgi:hypothetical protein